MEKIKALYNKYYEALAYLFFGGLGTVLNFIILNIFQMTMGGDFAAGIGNVINNCICILFAYWTNHNFVFKSKAKGKALLKEFGSFVTARIFTAVLDQGIMMGGVFVLGPAITFMPAELWANVVKLFSQVVVIVSNYVFSKLFIFKKKQQD